MPSKERRMAQPGSLEKRRLNSVQNQGFKHTCKMKKTDSVNQKTVADTYCQTMAVELKTENSAAEDLTISRYIQNDIGPYCDQPSLQCPQTSAYSTELGDPPLLRQPQHTTMTGIQQIIHCFRTGTVLAKLTLLKEVDTIFECQLCRSLFRGLPNLLEHRQTYCLSRHPVPNDPSQVLKDLLEAVFPQTDCPESPLEIIPEPVYGNQTPAPVPISHPQNSASLNLCGREPVVVLKRFQGVQHTASVTNDLVSKETVGCELIDSESNCKEGSHLPLQDTVPSTELEQPKSNLEWNSELRSESVKNQSSFSLKTVHVQLGRKDELKDHINSVDNSKKTSRNGVCKRKFIAQHTLVIDPNVRMLRKDSVKKAKYKLAPGSMKVNRKVCTVEPLSDGERCSVRQKPSGKGQKDHGRCNEVKFSLKQDATTPASAVQPGQYLSTETTPISQKQPHSKAVTGDASPQDKYTVPWMKGLFYCGLCKCNYSSQVLLMKHMSIAHKFHMLENSPTTSRTPPPREAKTKVKPEDKAFDDVRVYCWFCGKHFHTRKGVRSHCHRDHRKKLKEINLLLKQDTGNSVVHELHSLENGFAASHTPPVPPLQAREPK